MEEKEFTRKVKVPITTKKVVPTTFTKRILVKNFVEVEDFEVVDEEYTVFEERIERRERKGWEKTYEWVTQRRRRPVTHRVRKTVPVTVIEQVDQYEDIEVDTNREVDVHGFRIDEVEDRHLVEVEEWEVYELMPHKVGEMESDMVRDLGTSYTEHDVKREYGQTIYGLDGYHHADHAHLEVDTQMAHREITDSQLSSDVTVLHGTTSYSTLPTTYVDDYVTREYNIDADVVDTKYIDVDTTKYVVDTPAVLSGATSSTVRRAVAVDEY
jgi:hypothetical protein